MGRNFLIDEQQSSGFACCRHSSLGTDQVVLDACSSGHLAMLMSVAVVAS
jgi:hypothetical protein